MAIVFFVEERGIDFFSIKKDPFNIIGKLGRFGDFGLILRILGIRFKFGRYNLGIQTISDRKRPYLWCR